MHFQSSIIVSLALSIAISAAPSAVAFSHFNIKTRTYYPQYSSTELKYRSLHHGPDVEPLTDIEKLGCDFTKMSKDKIDRFGPGDFDQFVDFPSDQFDGGDSDMGLSGDGTMGLKKLGRDVSPHLARTLAAKVLCEESNQDAVACMSYADELLRSNPGMDEVRAQQLENWATQKEIALSNKYMNEKICGNYGSDDIVDYEVRNRYHMMFKNLCPFSSLLQGDIGGGS